MNNTYYVETCFSQDTVTKYVEKAKKQSNIKYKWCIKQNAYVQDNVDELVKACRRALVEANA